MFLVVGVAADLSHINTAAKVSRAKAFVIHILQLQAALAAMNTCKGLCLFNSKLCLHLATVKFLCRSFLEHLVNGKLAHSVRKRSKHLEVMDLTLRDYEFSSPNMSLYINNNKDF